MFPPPAPFQLLTFVTNNLKMKALYYFCPMIVLRSCLEMTEAENSGMDTPRPLTLLVLSGDMEKGLAACNLALAALAGGRRVTFFFSFWGLNFVKRPGARARGHLLARCLGLVNRDNAERQKLGRFHLLGAGRWALLRLMGRYNLLPVRQCLSSAHQMGARLLACSNTLQLMGLDRDDLIPEVDDVAGAMTFLDAAGEGIVITLA